MYLFDMVGAVGLCLDVHVESIVLNVNILVIGIILYGINVELSFVGMSSVVE